MRNRAKAIERIVEKLEALYGKPTYQQRYEPLDELVCCILSQHSTDAVAFPTFEGLREKYPNWEEIAKLTQKELAREIRRVGLPNQKAKHILGALKEIHKRTGSYSLDILRKMPTEEARQWLISLPGVGPKTAAIVLMFAFGRGIIPVDTHVFRVGWRLGFYDKRIGAAKAHDVLMKVVPEDLCYRFHLALIQHGRKICRARTPLCYLCPLTRLCAYYREK
ncbi:MAG TPA: endonuclease III [Fimbriimonadales bacterium]|nr:endonuclease III [Fimbriimonadales bacterium]